MKRLAIRYSLPNIPGSTIAKTSAERDRDSPHILGPEGSFFDIYLNPNAADVNLPPFPDPKRFANYAEFERAVLGWEETVASALSEKEIAKLPERLSGNRYDFPIYYQVKALDDARDTETNDLMTEYDDVSLKSTIAVKSMRESGVVESEVEQDFTDMREVYEDRFVWDTQELAAEPVPDEFDTYEDFERAFRRWSILVAKTTSLIPPHALQLSDLANLEIRSDVPLDGKDDGDDLFKKLEEKHELAYRQNNGKVRAGFRDVSIKKVHRQGKKVKKEKKAFEIDPLHKKGPLLTPVAFAKAKVAPDSSVFINEETPAEIKSILLKGMEKARKNRVKRKQTTLGLGRPILRYIKRKYPDTFVLWPESEDVDQSALDDHKRKRYIPPHSFKTIELRWDQYKRLKQSLELVNDFAPFRWKNEFVERGKKAKISVPDEGLTNAEVAERFLLNPHVSFYDFEEAFRGRNFIKNLSDLKFFLDLSERAHEENFSLKLGFVLYNLATSEDFASLAKDISKSPDAQTYLYRFISLLQAVAHRTIDLFSNGTQCYPRVYELFDSDEKNEALRLILLDYYWAQLEVLFRMNSWKFSDGLPKNLNGVLKKLHAKNDVSYSVLFSEMMELLSKSTSTQTIIKILFFLVQILKIRDSDLAEEIHAKGILVDRIVALSESRICGLNNAARVLWNHMLKEAHAGYFVARLFEGNRPRIQSIIGSDSLLLNRFLSDYFLSIAQKIQNFNITQGGGDGGENKSEDVSGRGISFFEYDYDSDKRPAYHQGAFDLRKSSLLNRIGFTSVEGSLKRLFRGRLDERTAETVYYISRIYHSLITIRRELGLLQGTVADVSAKGDKKKKRVRPRGKTMNERFLTKLKGFNSKSMDEYKQVLEPRLVYEKVIDPKEFSMIRKSLGEFKMTNIIAIVNMLNGLLSQTYGHYTLQRYYAINAGVNLADMLRSLVAVRSIFLMIYKNDEFHNLLLSLCRNGEDMDLHRLGWKILYTAMVSHQEAIEYWLEVRLFEKVFDFTATVIKESFANSLKYLHKVLTMDSREKVRVVDEGLEPRRGYITGWKRGDEYINTDLMHEISSMRVNIDQVLKFLKEAKFKEKVNYQFERVKSNQGMEYVMLSKVIFFLLKSKVASKYIKSISKKKGGGLGPAFIHFSTYPGLDDDNN